MNDLQAHAKDMQRFLLAVLGSDDGVWDWDIQTGQVFFSDRWKSMIGYESDEIGSSLEEWQSRVHPDDLPKVRHLVQRHWAGETESYSAEHRVRHKNGEYRWILDRGRVQFDSSGQPSRMTGTHVDVTERYLAQEAVLNLSEELQTILNLSPDGFVAFDRLGKVKYLTPAFERLTSLTAQQVIGLHEAEFWDLMVSVSKLNSKIGSPYDAPENLGQPKTLRRTLIELRVPEGRVLMVDQQTSGASAIAKMMSFRDVSHEVEVDRAKSTFLSKAAHELRAPLASIYGFSELLIDEEDVSKRKEFNLIVHKRAQAMLHLLDELLDLECIEARRKTDFRLTRVAVNELVQGVLDGFITPTGRDAPSLEAPHGDLHVCVDVKKAHQVVLNVLSNAFKYSPAGGPVTIGIAQVPSGSGASEVEIAVRDSGIGMTQSEVDRMFERFYRASSASDIPGSGLGMSIVKEIMTLLGGRVTVDSQPGVGTCVRLHLPLDVGGPSVEKARHGIV